jgi:peptide/nickel transport system substrate-binding protein
VEALTFGLVDPVYSLVPLSSPYSGPIQRAEMPYDVEAAKALLAEAGYAGEPIKLLTTQRFMTYFDAAVFIQAMAKEAGIEIEIEVLEWGTLLDRFVSGDYAAMVFGFSARLDAALSFDMISGDKASDPRKVWDNPAARELISSAMVEGDPAKRQVLFDALHGKFVEDLPMIPLWNSADIAAWRTNVTGYQPWPASMPRLWNVSLD